MSAKQDGTRSRTTVGTRIGVGVLTLAVAAGLTGVSAAAQLPGGGSQQVPPNQQTMPGQQNPNAPGNPGAMTPGMEATGPQSFADQAFVRTTLEGSAAEAQMSQLAEQKSSSSDVKQYGQHMVQIHQQLTHQMQPIAKKLGVNENPKPTKKEKKEIDALKTLSGPSFDQAYIQAMAKNQQHDVKTFKTEEQAAQDPMVQEVAKMDEPVFTEHLQVLQQIAQAHNVTIASNAGK